MISNLALTLVQLSAKIALIFVQFLTLQKIKALIIISEIYLFLTDSANYTIGDVPQKPFIRGTFTILKTVFRIIPY